MKGNGYIVMFKRVLTGLIAFVIMIPFLIFADTLVLPMGLAFCSFMAAFEVFRCVGLHRRVWLGIPFYLVAAAGPILMRLLGGDTVSRYTPVVILFLMLYTFFACVISHSKVDITAMCTALVTCLYSTIGISAIIYLHDFHVGGRYFYYLVFIGAWITDIFAYFTGVCLGKHKLIPEVSPKKTVEGSIGGVVFCVLAFLVFTFVYNGYLLPEGGESLSYVFMAVVGFLTSVVAQMGDLALSVLKRHYGIKDFGKIFPGHGGILDRFDSLTPVAIILATAFGLLI